MTLHLARPVAPRSAWRWLVWCGVLWLMAGCAATSITSQVESFGRWPEGRKPGTIAFDVLPSQQVQGAAPGASAGAAAATLQAVISNRYDVLSRYAESLKRMYRQELERLGLWSREAEALKPIKRYLSSLKRVSEAERTRIENMLRNSDEEAKRRAAESAERSRRMDEEMKRTFGR